MISRSLKVPGSDSSALATTKCGQMVVGYGSDRDSGAALERALRACHRANGGGADPEMARMASTPGAIPLPVSRTLTCT